MKERNYISWCNCSLIIHMMKGSQKIARRVPRKTVKTTTRWEDAVLLLFWLFLSFELMKLMSFVIFEKFLRIPDEKMSPLSGKYILRKKVLKSFICSGKNLDWFFIPVKKNWLRRDGDDSPQRRARAEPPRHNGQQRKRPA